MSSEYDLPDEGETATEVMECSMCGYTAEHDAVIEDGYRIWTCDRCSTEHSD